MARQAASLSRFPAGRGGLAESSRRKRRPTGTITTNDGTSIFYKDSSALSAQIVKDSTLKVYPGAPHGLANTTAYQDAFNTDLLDFLKA